MKKANYIILDCETGGLKASENPITQIALIIIDDKMNEINRYETYVKPYKDLKIEDDALKATGLKMRDINDGIDYSELVSVLSKIFKDAKPGVHVSLKPIIVGHNIKFDIEFLKELFNFKNKNFFDFVNETSIDTMTLSKMFKPNISSLKLEVCCDACNIVLNDAHKAMNDVIATTELLKFFIKKLRTNEKVEDQEQVIIKTREKFQF